MKKGAWIAPGALSLFSDVAKPRRRSLRFATPAGHLRMKLRTTTGTEPSGGPNAVNLETGDLYAEPNPRLGIVRVRGCYVEDPDAG